MPDILFQRIFLFHDTVHSRYFGSNLGYPTFKLGDHRVVSALPENKNDMEVKYDTIGKGYNLTRKADPFLSRELIKHLKPIKEGIYLDIGCGSGNYTSQLAEYGLQVIGVDPSIKMLEQAQLKTDTIDWRIGTAENIGLPDNFVNGAIGFLTIHHWSNLEKGFSELYRVLKSNSKIIIFTSTPEQMKGYWLNHYFPKMLKDSISQMPNLTDVQKAMKHVHLNHLATDKYFIHPDLQDKFLYCGKHDPSIYLDHQVRNGISSFSSLSNRTEVEQGLSKLKADIDSNEIKPVIESYDNDLGDYLFIVAQK